MVPQPPAPQVHEQEQLEQQKQEQQKQEQQATEKEAREAREREQLVREQQERELYEQKLREYQLRQHQLREQQQRSPENERRCTGACSAFAASVWALRQMGEGRVGDPLSGWHHVATRPTRGPLPIGSPVVKRCRSMGGRAYVATWPTCWSLLILSPAPKRWEHARRYGVCSHPVQLWATADFAPRYGALGTLQATGIM